MVDPNKQVYKHTHRCAQCSHASVELTQARPNHVYTCYWYVLLVMLYRNNPRQCLMYTYLGLLISMPDSHKAMRIGVLGSYYNYCITGLRKKFQGHSTTSPWKIFKTTFDVFETACMGICLDTRLEFS